MHAMCAASCPGLIVNADDLGRSACETNAALACHARGSVTSGSLMVFMSDSERAAAEVRMAGLSVGLHLNLSEPFSAGNVATTLRLRHERVCRFLKSSRYALVAFNPWLASDFDFVVKKQLDEFTRLFDRQPAHVDGHQHMHLATNVLWQKLLPQGMRVRRSFTFEACERSVVNLAYRRRVDAVLAKRHTLTDRFYGLSGHMSPSRLAGLCELSRTSSVELMVHPAREPEYRLLTDDDVLRFLRPAHRPARDRAPRATMTGA
jgi:predicted glycoside hydrolase/deacetylase ChbG (UPF0249 family)